MTGCVGSRMWPLCEIAELKKQMERRKHRENTRFEINRDSAN